MPKEHVITKEHQQHLTNEDQDRRHGTKKPRPLWNYFYKGVRQITSTSLVPPQLGTAIPCFVRALPFSASVLLLSDKH